MKARLVYDFYFYGSLDLGPSICLTKYKIIYCISKILSTALLPLLQSQILIVGKNSIKKSYFKMVTLARKNLALAYLGDPNNNKNRYF